MQIKVNGAASSRIIQNGNAEMKKIFLGAALAAFATIPAVGQTGPRGRAVRARYPHLLSGKSHGSRQIRTCLAASRDKVSAECRQALDTTGPSMVEAIRAVTSARMTFRHSMFSSRGTAVLSLVHSAVRAVVASMKLPLVVVVVLAAAGAGNAAAIDLHEYWDRNCANCHGHAAGFARRFLTVKDGRLRGQHHVDNLNVFLGNHYLARDLIAPVTAMLAAQAMTEPRFRNECGRCHASAAALARESLSLRDGVLVSRTSGFPTAEFLSGHARIKPADVPIFVDVLTRVLNEVGG